MAPPLFHLISKGKTREVEMMLNGAVNLLVRHNGGRTPLMHAIECRKVDMVELLLTCGKDVGIEARNQEGQTALILAVQPNGEQAPIDKAAGEIIVNAAR
jgi:ankyrin repeat protein